MTPNFKKSIYSILLLVLFYIPVSAWSFDDFVCVGSDPFWKLSMTARHFTFNQTKSVVMPSVEPKPSENMSLDHIKVFRTKMDNKEFVIVIQKQSCTDSKSADIFEYEGLLISSDKVFHGCCTKKILITK